MAMASTLSKLVALCLKKLLQFIDEFQVRELPDEDQVSMRIKIKNSNDYISLIPKTNWHVYTILKWVWSIFFVSKQI